jgi:hypothetical protein
MNTSPARALHISDADLRTRLPLAVLSRPADDDIDSDIWILLAMTLEATAHALACAADGTAASVVAVLIDHARGLTQLTQQALQKASGADFPPYVARPISVRRSWLRLSGLLLGPAANDASLLRLCLAEHCTALTDWKAAPLRAA